MPETRTIAIEVLRYQPAEASQPYLQTWSVPFTDDMSVLQGLQYIKDHLDGSLTFRWSCRMAICGSCGMMIGGVPRLGCRTFLRHFLPGPLRIEALAHFPIERDLVVDSGDFMTKLASIKPWIVPREERSLAQGEYRQTPAQLGHRRRVEQLAAVAALRPVAAAPPNVSSPRDDPLRDGRGREGVSALGQRLLQRDIVLAREWA